MKEKDWVRGMPRPGTPGLRETLQWAGHWPGIEHSLAGGRGGVAGGLPSLSYLVSENPLLISLPP